MSLRYQRRGSRVVEGRHFSFEREIAAEHQYRDYAGGESVDDFVAEYNQLSLHMQGLIGQARATRMSLRACGSLWSLSEAAVTDGELVNTKTLRVGWPIDERDLTPSYPADKCRLLR